VGKPTDLIQGMLDGLILHVIAKEPMHGWGIAQRIQERSKDALRVGQGALYPALQKLERQGLVTSTWAASENNRKAKYYRLTAAGRKVLEQERRQWARLSNGVALVFGTP
jgi:transcriptional regulator